LTFHNIDVLSRVHQKLLDTLKRRSDHDVGLESLAVQSCRVVTNDYETDLMDRVKKVTWEDVEEVGSDYDGTETEEEETDSDYSDESDY
jgi:hypothetical protein